MKSRYQICENRLTVCDDGIAAEPFETKLTVHAPLPKGQPLTARHVAQDIRRPTGVRKRAGLASRAMSTRDLLACFIGAFFGLVAAALLIAVLG